MIHANEIFILTFQVSKSSDEEQKKLAKTAVKCKQRKFK